MAKIGTLYYLEFFKNLLIFVLIFSSRFTDINLLPLVKVHISIYFLVKKQMILTVNGICSLRQLDSIQGDRLYERALRIAYSDYISSFEELLIRDKSTTIHQKNLRVVAVEMYKISHNMSPIFMEDLVRDINTKRQIPLQSRAK